jgi:hypothetical protein
MLHRIESKYGTITVSQRELSRRTKVHCVTYHAVTCHLTLFYFIINIIIISARRFSRSRNRRIIVPTSGIAGATPKGRHCGGPPRSSVRVSLGRSQFARQNIHGRQSPRALVPVDADSRHGLGVSFCYAGTCSCRIVRLAKNCGT